MTIKAWPRGHKVTELLTIADKGKECRIDVNVTGSTLYGDSIKIKTHDGTVQITGNHVHELMLSVLRFSSKEMLETWIRFALMTNQASDDRNIDMNTDHFYITAGEIKNEKEMREWEKKWNDNYFTKRETVA